MSLEGMVAMDTELFLMNSRIMYILHVSIHMAQSKVKSKWNSIYCLPVVAIDNLRQVQGSYEAGVDLCHVEPLQTFHYGRHSATMVVIDAGHHIFHGHLYDTYPFESHENLR